MHRERNGNILFGIFVLFISLYFASCIEKPLAPVLPQWDVALTVPLSIEKTMGQMLDKSNDSTLTYDAASDSVLMYYSKLNISPIFLSDSLKIDPQVIDSKILVSDFTFQPTQKFQFSLSPSSLGISQGALPLLPPISKPNTILQPAPVSDPERLDVASGTGKLVITNSFPFDAVFSNFIIRNSGGSEIWRGSSINVSKNGSQTVNMLLDGKTITNNVELAFDLSSPGSTSPVTINASTAISLEISLQDIKIKSAKLSLTQQTYTLNNSISFDNSFQSDISSAKLKTGQLKIEINNITGLSSDIKIKFLEIFNGNNNLEIPFSVSPQENKSPIIYDLSNCSIFPNKNKIDYQIQVTTRSTAGKIDILTTDQISYKVTISNVSFNSIEGKIKTSTAQINKTVNLPIEDIKKYFDGSARLSEADIELNLYNGMGLPFNFANGQITGYNSSTGKTELLTVPNTTINSNSNNKILLDKTAAGNFLSAFFTNNAIPSTVQFTGLATINPNNAQGKITSNDYISGNVDMKIPLRLSITNIRYKDTIDVSLKDSDKEQIDKLNSGQASITTLNSLPAGLKLSMNFLDNTNKIVFSLPKDQSSYVIQSAVTNSNGSITNSQESKFSTSLDKTDISKIRDSKSCIFVIDVNTPDAPSKYVSIRRQDKIKVNLVLQIGYHVKQ